MNSRVRIGILIAIVGVILAGAGLFVLNTIFRSVVAPLPQPTSPPPLTEEVIITTHDIKLGAVIRPEDLTTAKWPVEAIPRNAIKSKETVIGRMTTAPLVTGEIILAHHLADPTNIQHDLAFSMDESKVMIAFPASDLMSTLNIIQRGDIVDILASINIAAPAQTPGAPGSSTSTDQGATTKMYTFFAMQRIGVTAMVVDIVNQGSSSGTASDTGANPDAQPQKVNVRAYLLAVAPQDALVLKNLMDTGAIFDFALRNPKSAELFNVQPVLDEYLIDQYQLKSRR